MPVDPKTGKEYPYTEEGIAQHKEDTGGMPMKESAFKLRSGNATPFKQLGSSPAKQDYYEALDHWKEYKQKAKKVKNIAKNVTKKVIKTGAKRNPYVLATSMLFGKTSKADQPTFKEGDVHYQDPEKKIDFTGGE